MKVTVTSNTKQVLAAHRALAQKHRFAAAQAINATLRMARDTMPAALERDLDRPTPFTKRGFAVRPARKSDLQGFLVILPMQAAYLQYQIKGGRRAPKRIALRLPGQLKLNEFGNMPAGTIKRLVQRAKEGKRATRAQSRRFGVSNKVDLFYGEPGDGRPAGIYKRVRESGGRGMLVPLVLLPKRSASYKRRFDFYGHADRVVRTRFPSALQAAVARYR